VKSRPLTLGKKMGTPVRKKVAEVWVVEGGLHAPWGFLQKRGSQSARSKKGRDRGEP